VRPEDLSAFLPIYEDYVRTVLSPTRDELKRLFDAWKDPTYWASHRSRTRLPAPSPIQRAIRRIKRPERVVDKIMRNPSAFPDGLSLESVRKMYDAVGGRIVVYFLSNLPLIDSELRESTELELSQDDPPIAYLTDDLARRHGLGHLRRQEKDSGYASIHYTVRFRSSAVPKGERPWFEIQVRTLAEDLWGEIEHVLGYRPEKRTSFAVRRQFQILGLELAAIDEHFNLLYEELSRFQYEVVYADTNPLNAENLPAVLSDLGIGCAQREIDGLLKLLASRGFDTIGQLCETASARNVQIIRNTYRSEEGEEPSNFDIVAGLAAIRESKSETEVIAALKAQIKFLKTWEKLRREFS